MTSRLLVIAIACALIRIPHAAADPTGPEVYQQAVAAFTAGDNGAALSLAMRAVTLPGPHKLAAKFLYGDALFRSGQLLRARAVYIALHTMTMGDERASATKKIVATNRKLGLDDDDGMPRTALPAALPPAVKPGVGDALYARAIAAVRINDLDSARELAIKAATEDGVHRIDAKVLYGDLLARRGEHARAKDVFVALRRVTNGDVRAIVTAKVVAENRALQLPDTDGITD